MITIIKKSIFRKPIAVVLSLSFLLMSFSAGGDAGVVLNAGTSINLETVSTIQSDMVVVGLFGDYFGNCTEIHRLRFMIHRQEK